MILQQFEKIAGSEEHLGIEPEREDSFLVVIDRKIDLVTPLLTAHSYEGLIDHFYEIDHRPDAHQAARTAVGEGGRGS